MGADHQHREGGDAVMCSAKVKTLEDIDKTITHGIELRDADILRSCIKLCSMIAWSDSARASALLERAHKAAETIEGDGPPPHQIVEAT